MSKVRVKFIRRPLIQRFGADPVSVSMDDAVRYIKNKDAVAVSDMDGPPVKKIITRPGVQKGGQVADVNPTLEKPEEKKRTTNSRTQNGKQKVTIRLKK